MKPIWMIAIVIVFIGGAVVSVDADGPHPMGIVTDGTVGSAGKISLTGPDYQIKAEYGQQAGGNLFHSFQQFNLHYGESANFIGPDSVHNIISRVTGGSASWIDGVLRSSIAGANLYFLNPSGVMFGSAAQLDMTGSFHVSTADYLRIGETGRWYSSGQTENLLQLTGSPSAFGFLTETGPEPITFEGNTKSVLQVPAGQTISVIGGDIGIIGSDLNAPEGKINIAGLASPGEVIPKDSDLTVTCPTLGSVNLSNGALVKTSGQGSGDVFIRSGSFYLGKSAIEADTKGDQNGGITDIRTQTLSLNNGDIFSDTSGKGCGGNISIHASESAFIDNFSRLFADSTGKNSMNGNAGNVLIETPKLSVSRSSYISSETYGNGNGGSVTIHALDSVDISGEKSQIATRSNGKGKTGNAGDIMIETNRLSLSESCIISSDTYGLGTGGTVTITGVDNGFAESILIDSSRIYSGSVWEKGNPYHVGDGGSVLLKAENISLINGAYIGAEAFETGRGGDVSLLASHRVNFSGVNAKGSPSKIYTTALYTGEDAGSAGNIAITTGDLICTDGAKVRANTLGPGQGGSIDIQASGTISVTGVNPIGETSEGYTSIDARSEGQLTNAGKAGDIRIRAGSLWVENGGVITNSTLGPGPSGSITLDVIGAVNIASFPSGVYSRSESTSSDSGPAGSIVIKAADLILTEDGKISTSTQGGGDAGSVTLQTLTVALDNHASISSSTASSGNAGMIDIESMMRTTLQNGAFISTATESMGNAGAIYVNTGDLQLSTGAVISSASNAAGKGGEGGTIRIQAKNTTHLNNSSISTSIQGTGNAGAIDLKTAHLELDQNAFIASSSNSRGYGGNAGTVTINAAKSAGIFNNSSVSTSTQGTGNAGSIVFETPILVLDHHASIASTTDLPLGDLSGGQAGTILINVPWIEGGLGGMTVQNHSVVSTSTDGAGHAGAIEINTSRLDLSYAGSVSSSSNSTGAGGDAGAITVKNLDGSADLLRLQNSGSISTASQGAGKGGDILLDAKQLELSSGAFITAAGTNGNAGTITIVSTDTPSGLLSLNDASISTSTHGTGDAGSIELEVARLELTQGASVSSSSNALGPSGDAGTITIRNNDMPVEQIAMSDYAFISTSSQGMGNAGAIAVEATDLRMDTGSAIKSTGNNGDAGTITINAKDTASRLITLQNNSSISTSTQGIGTAGDILLQTEQMEVDSGSLVSSSSLSADNGGDAGTIIINAMSKPSDAIRMDHAGISTSTEGLGNAGAITLQTQILELTHRASVSSSSNSCTEGGNAGTITVNAGDNASSQISLDANSLISTSSAGQGIGGNILIETHELELNRSASITSTGNIGDAGNISVSAKTGASSQITLADRSTITTSSNGVGNAGAIRLETQQLNLDTGSSVSSSNNATGVSGNAGTIIVNAQTAPSDAIYLTHGSSISTSNDGSGKGGDIVIEGIRVQMDDHSSLASTGYHGDAGMIVIHAADLIDLQNESAVTTSTQGRGNAGSIWLETPCLTMSNHSSASSSSLPTGQGGNAGTLVITGTDRGAETIVLNQSSITTSAAGSGKGGDIRLEVLNLKLDQSGVKSTGVNGDAGTILINGKNTSDNVITLSNHSSISTSSSGAGNAGAIRLETSQLALDHYSSVASSSHFTGTGGGDAGSITVTGKDAAANAVRLDHQSEISTSSEGQGKGGHIILNVKTLQTHEASWIQATGHQGDAGTITISAGDAGADSVLLQNNSGVSTSTKGLGNAGTIDLNAAQLEMNNGAVISSASLSASEGGNAGSITVTASDSVRLTDTGTSISTETFGQGRAGSIAITTPIVRLSNGATVSSASRSASEGGNAGSITVTASDSVWLTDTGTSIGTETFGQGQAGSIAIQTPNFRLDNGATVSSASRSAGTSGNAGSIAITSNEIALDHQGAINTESSGTGKAGDIQIQTASLKLDNQASVTSASLSENQGGDAGFIGIRTEGVLMMTSGSSITTEATSGGGGKISVSAQNVIHSFGADITSSVRQGHGNGGDMTLSSEYIILNHSSVTANAVEGDGGAIFIYTDNYIRSEDTRVTATSKRGNDGTVQIVAPDLDLSASLIILPNNFIDATKWIVKACAERGDEKVSRFIWLDEEGVPLAMDEWIASP